MFAIEAKCLATESIVHGCGDAANVYQQATEGVNRRDFHVWCNSVWQIPRRTLNTARNIVTDARV